MVTNFDVTEDYKNTDTFRAYCLLWQVPLKIIIKLEITLFQTYRSVSQVSQVILSKATCSKQKSMVNYTYSNHFVPFEVLLGIFVWFLNSKQFYLTMICTEKNTLFRPFSGNTTWYPFGRDVTRPCFTDFPRVYWVVFSSIGKCIVTQYVSSSKGHSSFAQSVLGQNGPWAK